jgi:hypothetical protein
MPAEPATGASISHLFGHMAPRGSLRASSCDPVELIEGEVVEMSPIGIGHSAFVADSSLQYDQTIKLDLYARRGIGEHWVVDANDANALIVHVYRSPTGSGYRQHRMAGRGDTVATLGVPGESLAVDAIFARALTRAP